jgi:multiple sugar transport system permease protein
MGARALPEAGRVAGSAPPRRRRPLSPEAAAGYGFIAPAAVLMVGMIGFPFVLALWFSVTETWVGRPGPFVGLANFVRLAGNGTFQQTLVNSLLYTFWAVLLKAVLGFALALLLLRITRFERLIRGAILLPFVIPTALSTLAWWWMFEPTYSVLNWTGRALNLIQTDVPWLSDPTLAKAAIIVVNVWRGLPFFAITILAGLVAIPDEYYEAAETDGAGPWQQFRNVTLPLVKPVLGIVVLFSTILTMADFNIVYLMTRGGPMNSTHLFSTLAHQAGLASGRLSEGAAISLFLFPLLVVVVIVQLRLIRRQTAYE